MVPLKECLKDPLIKVEFDRVVRSRDGLDVPVDELVLLHTLDVLEVGQREEVNEDGPAGDD